MTTNFYSVIAEEVQGAMQCLSDVSECEKERNGAVDSSSSSSIGWDVIILTHFEYE